MDHSRGGTAVPRCAFDHQRLKPEQTAELDGYLVHVAEGGVPIEPVHEIFEGRLLAKKDKQWNLKTGTIPVTISY
ncbi:MAG TPA: hypothetical protein VNO51_22980, partial [Ilumatobacteraceae bacterium]|nr:hypothetical protein [Ilumatobacteraceae bacterium]